MVFNHLVTFVFVLAACQAIHAYPAQKPLHSTALRGRFLHITDIHPDPYYKTNSSVSSACHRKKPKNNAERAGYWGTAWKECDSPLVFVNATFDYLEGNWADEVDFVIWTGDSARHDNDRKIPRTPTEIYDLNRMVALQMEETFGKRGIPVVPTLGNNDVWPHNILAAGPNPITNTFVEIWRSFIPFPSYQVFQRGAYFSIEVIPNNVAVISLNTMYFYDYNKAVRGCQYKVAEDPGNLQFDWLDVQLGLFRARDMQVYLMGHVPPSPRNYFPECFRRYVELSLSYQDTIIGHIYGHKNVDHFFFLNDSELFEPPVSVGSRKHSSLDKALHENFATVPEEPKTDEGNYTVVMVSPSVVANPYLPSFRVFSYNITGLNQSNGLARKKKKGSKRKHDHKGGKKKDCTKKKNRDDWACRPRKPQHADPNSPSRSNVLWTPLGYAQYYMPDLQTSNRTRRPSWELEYVTYRLSVLHPDADATSPGVAGFAYPVPLHLLPVELRNLTGVRKSSLAPYEIADLTIGSWLRFARRLVKEEKLWRRFTKLMYLGG